MLFHGLTVGHKTYSTIVSGITLGRTEHNCFSGMASNAVADSSAFTLTTPVDASISFGTYIQNSDLSVYFWTNEAITFTAITATSDIVEPCSIVLEQEVAAAQTFNEHTSNSFSFATQCREVSGCGGTLAESNDNSAGCFAYGSGNAQVTACSPEGSYDVSFTCAMDGESTTDT